MAASDDAGDSFLKATNDLVLGVDVGGTFTDCLLLEPNSGRIKIAKVPTTPKDQSVGFMNGVDALGLDLSKCRSVVHGTTAATNAVLERKGARCGLITTRGFRDILEMARRTRPQLFGLTGTFEAIIPREFRYEVTERLDASGRVVQPLIESEVVAVTKALLEQGVEAIVVHFMHSYVNSAHEKRCVELIREIWPNGHITAGSEILPEIREYERGSAAAMNGYVQPIMTRYLSRLREHLHERSFASELLVMQGNGGMMNAQTASSHAIHTVMSGPAAGAIAAGQIGQQAGFPDLITCDMGGTSFDVSVVLSGLPTVTRERNIDYALPMRLPMVDIHTIGAGGGSIARVTAGGLLQVGPQSAGADPGAIGYGRGGTEPTVTDANLVLGRINPTAITGASESADIPHVRRILEDKIGRPLEMDAVAVAEGIIEVANNAMADAIRFVLAEKGVDQRDFAIFAFGGAGPLHAADLARRLGVPRVLVPKLPGMTSALGCVLADVRHDYGVTVGRPLREIGGGDIDGIFGAQEAEGLRLIEQERVAVSEILVSREVDMLYAGQTHVMRLPIDNTPFDPLQIENTFSSVYRERFDADLSDMRPVLMAVRTTVVGRRGGVSAAIAGEPLPTTNEPTSSRQVRFEGDWYETPIYRRDRIGLGVSLPGPLIVEQIDTTTVVAPKDNVEVDQWGNLIIDIDGRRARGEYRDAA